MVSFFQRIQVRGILMLTPHAAILVRRKTRRRTCLDLFISSKSFDKNIFHRASSNLIASSQR